MTGNFRALFFIANFSHIVTSQTLFGDDLMKLTTTLALACLMIFAANPTFAADIVADDVNNIHRQADGVMALQTTVVMSTQWIQPPSQSIP